MESSEQEVERLQLDLDVGQVLLRELDRARERVDAVLKDLVAEVAQFEGEPDQQESSTVSSDTEEETAPVDTSGVCMRIDEGDKESQSSAERFAALFESYTDVLAETYSALIDSNQEQGLQALNRRKHYLEFTKHMIEKHLESVATEPPAKALKLAVHSHVDIPSAPVTSSGKRPVYARRESTAERIAKAEELFFETLASLCEAYPELADKIQSDGGPHTAAEMQAIVAQLRVLCEETSAESAHVEVDAEMPIDDAEEMENQPEPIETPIVSAFRNARIEDVPEDIGESMALCDQVREARRLIIPPVNTIVRLDDNQELKERVETYKTAANYMDGLELDFTSTKELTGELIEISTSMARRSDAIREHMDKTTAFVAAIRDRSAKIAAEMKSDTATMEETKRTTEQITALHQHLQEALAPLAAAKEGSVQLFACPQEIQECADLDTKFDLYENMLANLSQRKSPAKYAIELYVHT